MVLIPRHVLKYVGESFIKLKCRTGEPGLGPLIVSYIANLIDLSAEDVLRSVLEIPNCYLLSRLTLLLVTVRNS